MDSLQYTLVRMRIKINKTKQTSENHTEPTKGKSELHCISQQQPRKPGPVKNVVTILTEKHFQPWFLYSRKRSTTSKDGIKTFSDIHRFENWPPFSLSIRKLLEDMLPLKRGNKTRGNSASRKPGPWGAAVQQVQKTNSLY